MEIIPEVWRGRGKKRGRWKKGGGGEEGEGEEEGEGASDAIPATRSPTPADDARLGATTTDT